MNKLIIKESKTIKDLNKDIIQYKKERIIFKKINNLCKVKDTYLKLSKANKIEWKDVS